MNYKEKASYSPVAKIGLFVLLIVFAYLWYKLIHAGMPFGGLVVLSIGSVIMIFFLRFFYNMEFRINDECIVAEFGNYGFPIPLKDIASMEVVPVTMKEGLGLVVHKGRLAFVSNHKKGVRLKLKSGHYRDILLTTKNPEDFIKKVKQAEHDAVKGFAKKVKEMEKAERAAKGKAKPK
ncbi:MAG: hypothetical protein ACE5FW_03450 [Candidatus Aenigmatarchaeota archaeon]